MGILKPGLAALAAACFLAGCGTQTANINSNAGANRASINASPSPVRTPETNGATAGSSAENFWTDAAVGGMAEVELGRLAVSKAQSADVKKFAQMMVEDHGRANDELKALASKRNIQLPTDLDAKHRSTVDRLKGMSGAEFDRAYVDEMVEDHETDVEAFEKQSESATDPDAKAFATKTLPTLKKHLEAIKQIEAKMK